MLTKATLLALLAALASATPISPRTYPTVPSVNGSHLPTTALITATVGWSPSVAAGIEACAVGVASGSVDSATKAALASWVIGAGATIFDVATCKEITTWCTSSSDITLSASFQMIMEGALIAETSISAAGGVLSFLNGVIEAEYDGVPCLCSVLGAAERAALLAYLDVEPISGALKSEISGALTMCAAGGIAETLSSATIDALSVWISGAECTLSADLKGPVLAWISAGSGGLTVGASIGGASANVILGSSSHDALISFMGGSAFAGLDVDIQGAMHACAAGGVAGVLSGGVKASISAWLSAPCPLDSGLKVSLQAWIGGSMGSSTQAGTSVGAYGYVSVGSTISGHFKANASGVLTPAAQASLTSFCGSPAGLALEVGILSPLKSCAAGKLASSIEVTAANALAEFLSSSSCSLDVELRGAVIMWLSLGITGVSGAATGVGKGCGAGISISPELTAPFTAAISAGLSMSSTCKGALGVAIAGEAAMAVSSAGRAELSAYLLSADVKGMAVEVKSALFGWIMGTKCSCSAVAPVKPVPATGGYPTSSGSSAKPTSYPTSESSKFSSGSSSTLTDSSTQFPSSATESSSSESSKSLANSSTTSSGTESSSTSSSSESEFKSISTGEETSGDDDECDA